MVHVLRRGYNCKTCKSKLQRARRTKWRKGSYDCPNGCEEKFYKYEKKERRPEPVEEKPSEKKNKRFRGKRRGRNVYKKYTQNIHKTIK